MQSEWKKDVRKLRKVFEAALRLKVKTMTGDWMYEVILPVSGTMFLKPDMRVEDGPLESGPVHLALAPGIRCYKQEGRRADSNSFRRSGSESGVGPDWIHKAVVLLS